MKDFKKFFSHEIVELRPLVYRVSIYLKDTKTEVCTLYYERPKKTWTHKPIMSQHMVCIDAKVHEEHIYVKGIVEPRELVRWGSELITSIPAKNSFPNGQENIPEE